MNEVERPRHVGDLGRGGDDEVALGRTRRGGEDMITYAKALDPITKPHDHTGGVAAQSDRKGLCAHLGLAAKNRFAVTTSDCAVHRIHRCRADVDLEFSWARRGV